MSGDDSAFSWTQAEKDLLEGIDTTVPHSARIWNYWLGGKDNYPVDRQAGDEFCKIYPGIVEDARDYRAFLVRAVRYLAGDAGIRQFLDVGTGLPTEDNTHDVAQRIAPTSRIVYVDNDPLVLAHARALLTSAPQGVTHYVDADLHEPRKILDAAAETLDFTKPVALILSGILGHVADDETAQSIVTQLVDGLPPGSYLMLQDSTTLSQENAKALEAYNESGAVSYNLRDPEKITRFFDGLELVEPGVVPIQLWRPEGTPAGLPANVNPYGGVGRKG
jgi:O-methyltransferase involved in polyketide biosynthesis